MKKNKEVGIQELINKSIENFPKDFNFSELTPEEFGESKDLFQYENGQSGHHSDEGIANIVDRLQKLSEEKEENIEDYSEVTMQELLRKSNELDIDKINFSKVAKATNTYEIKLKSTGHDVSKARDMVDKYRETL